MLYDKIQHSGCGLVANTALGEKTTQVYGAFTDLLVLRGRTDYFDSILDRCFRLSVLAALTEWIHKAMQKSKPTQ